MKASLAAALRTFREGLVGLLRPALTVAMGLLVLDVLWGVASRYLLRSQSPWTEEAAIYLLVWISLIGASLTYGDRGHLGLDLLVNKLEPGARRLAAIFAEMAMTAFSVLVLLKGGWELVVETVQAGQLSPALQIPVGWVYAAVPISGLLFLAFSLERLGEHWLEGQR